MCAAMNNCNNGKTGTCQSNGQCVCNKGWKGADCALEAIGFDKKSRGESKLTNGTEWFYIQIEKTHGPFYIQMVSSSVKFSVFLSAGSDSNPNQFNFDMEFKNVQKLKISDNLIPRGNLTAAIQVHGYDTLNNTPLSNEIQLVYWTRPIISDVKFIN